MIRRVAGRREDHEAAVREDVMTSRERSQSRACQRLWFDPVPSEVGQANVRAQKSPRLGKRTPQRLPLMPADHDVRVRQLRRPPM
jgi:hypothetical protein